MPRTARAEVAAERTTETADAVVRCFADFATRLTCEDLTVRAPHSAKRRTLDAIGCGLAAQRTELICALKGVVGTQSRLRPAGLFGSNTSTTPEMAASR